MEKLAKTFGEAALELCSHRAEYLVGAPGRVDCTNCGQTIWQAQEDCMHFSVAWDDDGDMGMCLSCEKDVEREDFV